MNTNFICRYPQWVAACAVVVTSSAFAQAPAPSDPFVRDGNVAAPASSGQPEQSQNIYGLLEYFEVPRDAWLSYSAAHPVGNDASELRAEVQRWVGAGKANPIEISCSPTLPGNRSVVESIVEWRYATEYVMAVPTPIPSTFETRNTGYTLEWEPILDADLGAISIQMAPQMVTYMGDAPKRDAAKLSPAFVPQPRFSTNKPSLNILTKHDQPCLIQVSTPFDENGKPRENVQVLTFFRSAAVTTTPAPKGLEQTLSYNEGGRQKRMPLAEWTALKANESARPRVKDLEDKIAEAKATFEFPPIVLEVERMEITVADLNLWFANKPLATATGGLREAARQWVGAGRGKEIDRRTGPMRSKNRTVWENIYEYRYPVSYTIEGYVPDLVTKEPQTFAEQIQRQSMMKPVKSLDNPIVAPSAFETRNTGFTVEIEPNVFADGRSVWVQIAVKDIRAGNSQVLHRREVGGRAEPDVEQPIFNTMHISTNFAIGLGETRLLSISPAGEQQQADPARRILTFVTIRN